MPTSQSTTAEPICEKFVATFDVLGRKWNGLIIEVLLKDGPSRFKDLAQAITRCSDRVLVERLKELEMADLVARKTFEDSALIMYELTERGEAMRPMMTAIHEWSDKYNGGNTCNEAM
ncbi:helix-turn-helix transcriptional regulator [Weissella diestrammenae]|uniref:Helix-turn-helix transcriptional regulator n=1 Tax=Weissella diestrammenae TaxID=1162633 RepID=A0A7G9T6K5_9LACO|nr:helix-turn-helix domain-containing protein [Weissella diestrammenae]MCM0582992.1 helix-turn-helix transcriptional regulator [Weissella diestrammenae]QNN75730.1 helix-turn-helix transcriptional regulator [Weissella diestrammenae]